MEYVYTTLLLHEAKQEINEASVKKVLSAASIRVDEGKVKALVASLADVNIDEAIKEIPMAAAPAVFSSAGRAERLHGIRRYFLSNQNPMAFVQLRAFQRH